MQVGAYSLRNRIQKSYVTEYEVSQGSASGDSDAESDKNFRAKNSRLHPLQGENLEEVNPGVPHAITQVLKDRRRAQQQEGVPCII